MAMIVCPHCGEQVLERAKKCVLRCNIDTGREEALYRMRC